MAHCSACKKFMLFSSKSGYCKECEQHFEEMRIKEEAKRKAQEEAERKAQEEVERKAQEERRAREEAERKAKEEAERRAVEEKERIEKLQKQYLESIVDIPELTCPKCGGHYFWKEYINDGFYLCGNRPNGLESGICGTYVKIHCKGCDKDLPTERFGKRGDEWECKECGRVQWGLTARKRQEEKWEQEREAIRREMGSFLRDLHEHRW